MTRDDIIICIANNMDGDSIRAHEVIQEEIESRLPRTGTKVTFLPGLEDKTIDEVTCWFNDRMEQVIHFCESSVIEAVNKPTPPAPKTGEKGFWNLLGDVLKLAKLK